MKAHFLLLWSVCLVLAGCSNIRSKQPVGEKPVDLSVSIGDVELAGIAGEWVNSDGEVVVITVVDAEKGVVLYAPRDHEEGEEPMKLELRMTGDHVFVNMPAEENGERQWKLMGGDMNELLVWEPDRNLFRKLIAEGKIKGMNDPETRVDAEGKEVKNNNPGAVIDDPEGEWVKKMVAGEFGVLVDWRNPTVLRRVVKEEEGGAESEVDDRPAESASEMEKGAAGAEGADAEVGVQTGG